MKFTALCAFFAASLDRGRVARRLGRYRLGFGLVALLSIGHIVRNCHASGVVGHLGLPTPPDSAGTILMVNLGFFGLVGTVITLAGHPVLAPLRWRPLCGLGLISYGVYLYHWTIYWVLDGYTARDELSFWHGAARWP